MITWDNTEAALESFGLDLENIGKKTLDKQHHIRTGRLYDSIRSKVVIDKMTEKNVINVGWLNYGDYAPRWYKKTSRSIRKKPLQRDIPTFNKAMVNASLEIKNIIRKSAEEDLEANISTFVKEFNQSPF